jgi:hypothetical protein
MWRSRTESEIFVEPARRFLQGEGFSLLWRLGHDGNGGKEIKDGSHAAVWTFLNGRHVEDKAAIPSFCCTGSGGDLKETIAEATC